jgi:hypothetical protein
LKDDFDCGRQHLGARDRSAEAKSEARLGCKVVVGLRTKPVGRRQQVRRQDDAHPSVRRKNGDAEADVGVGIHLRKKEQSTPGKSKFIQKVLRHFKDTKICR